MQDAAVVAVLRHPGEQFHQLRQGIEIPEPMLGELDEVRATDKLQDVVENKPILLVGRIHRLDVGVGQFAEQAGLTAQAAPGSLTGILARTTSSKTSRSICSCRAR